MVYNPIFQFILILSTMVMMMTAASAQNFKPNYDESKVPEYTLPDPLVCEDGTKVDDVETWESKRRPEIMSLFETHVYGKTPDKEFPLEYDIQVDDNAVDGKAIRKQIALYPLGSENNFKSHLLIYLPKEASKPVPTFVGLNFRGNHTVYPDPEIWISDKVVETRKRQDQDYDPEAILGDRIGRWQIEMIIDRGYGIATMCYHDIDPDYDDGFQNGIHPYFYDSGQSKPEPGEWGSIGAWSWGLSRIMDYFEQDDDIDYEHVALMGHSRLGKTSLWAGAQDERFAIVISNDSGCGGAALSRRQFGETVGRINSSFPHWFCDNFNKYNQNEDELPVDQHQLIALMAPRPVYVASAEEDRWADPKGEFLSALHAEPVYQLYGLKGLGVDEMPQIDHPVGHTIGYHIRSGGHDVKAYDWQQYLDFADKHFNR